MGRQASAVAWRRRGWPWLAYRLPETYGVVLLLIIADYIAASTLLGSSWGRVCTVFLLGVTLWFTFRVCQSRPIWQWLAALFLLANTILALAVALASGADSYGKWTATLGGLLLLVTPFVILRRLASSRVVTTDTVIGAVCVYLLIGFSFAFMYLALAKVSPVAFFEGKSPATIDNTLFFSYSTLTTVGYGNLVPAGSLGQTFAMLEALFGQIFLVLIVARLVSLWGQERPGSSRRSRAIRAIAKE